MSFSSDAWIAAATWYDAIRKHPFLTGLADGTLERTVFLRYLADDAHYLSRYARALATTAARWPDPAQAAVIARFAAGAVDAERLLHEALLAEAGTTLADALGEIEPTPTCLAYANTLQSDAALAPAGVALAGLLPCFRVYTEVGRELVAVLDGAQRHPYETWLRTYADPAFEADTRRAESFADEQAERHPGTVAAMHEAYARATRFEWMFWDAAWRGETWPLPA
ncbi:TenA family protein [Jiangella anatolica]|uniref:Thiaminase II n=1 Tax=Jiangella anatolica TaxID=2670374 RepID=A0A2W2BGA2_9ACTN|nr:TenA family protein [Jiangella anatolica]PZF86225.1 thiaminase II [Jiangella anatolica]